jgi:hypothetical protein
MNGLSVVDGGERSRWLEKVKSALLNLESAAR